MRKTTKDAKDWDLIMHKVQWSMNSQKNTTSGFSPNELTFDYQPINLIRNQIVAAIQDDSEDNPKIPIKEKRMLAAVNIKQERELVLSVTKYCEKELLVLEKDPQATGDSLSWNHDTVVLI